MVSWCWSRGLSININNCHSLPADHVCTMSFVMNLNKCVTSFSPFQCTSLLHDWCLQHLSCGQLYPKSHWNCFLGVGPQCGSMFLARECNNLRNQGTRNWSLSFTEVIAASRKDCSIYVAAVCCSPELIFDTEPVPISILSGMWCWWPYAHGGAFHLVFIW